MIRKRKQLIILLLVLTDDLLLTIAYMLSRWLWLSVLKHDPWNVAASAASLPAAAAYASLVVLVQALLGGYDPGRSRRLRRQLPTCWIAHLLGCLCGISVMYLTKYSDFSRGVVLLFYGIGCLLLSLRHTGTVHLLRHLRRKGYNRRHVLVIGTGALAMGYRDDLLKHPELGLSISGFVGPAREGLNVLSGTDGLPQVLKQHAPDEVIVALDSWDSHVTGRVIMTCEAAGVRVSVVPFYNELIPGSVTIESMGSTRLISLRSNPLDNLGNAFMKRSMDVVVSLLALVLFSPLLLIGMLGVRLSGPGPILFRQERVGLNGKRFTMLKLRSMTVCDDKGWTTQSDPRRTRFGSLIRKLSIDELPQLVNVLRGDMSLVGPRPEVPHFVEEYARSVPRYMVKHQVRPGMTGLAQVNGWRGDTDIPSRIACDIRYIEQWSLWMDISILVRTALGGFINQEKVGKGKQ